MKYLRSFNRKLAKLMDEKNLDLEAVSVICSVEEAQVERWLTEVDARRAYPNLDQLIDLCLRTGASLETVLDIDVPDHGSQLELPGLAFVEDSDIARSLDVLARQIDKVVPTEQEVELLRRFRRSTDENRKLIIQLMN